MTKPELLNATVTLADTFMRLRPPTSVADIPGILQAIHNGLASLSIDLKIAVNAEPSLPIRDPAVPIRESVTPDYIVCLEDGKRMKLLKGHIRRVYGLTPQQYRERWGLPDNYPMTAPNYAEKRRGLANDMISSGKFGGKKKEA